MAENRAYFCCSMKTLKEGGRGVEEEEPIPPEEVEGRVDWMLIPFSRKTEEWRTERHEKEL